MAEDPRPDEVAPTWLSRVATRHFAECEQWKEFLRVYGLRKGRKRWLRFVRYDVPLLIVTVRPDWCPPVKGVG